LAECDGTFHGTLNYKVESTLLLDIQNKLEEERQVNNIFMASQELAPLSFNLICSSPLGKNPIFPHSCVCPWRGFQQDKQAPTSTHTMGLLANNRLA
jgi:hypothetical protein